MANGPDFFDAGEIVAVADAVGPQDDHDLAGVISRPPVPIAVMFADRPRQPIARTEKVDGGRFAPAVRENRRLRLFGRRERVIHPRHLTHHVLPAELIGEILRKWSIVLMLERGRPQSDPALIM